MNNSADRFTFVHQLKGFIDLIECQCVGYKRF